MKKISVYLPETSLEELRAFSWGRPISLTARILLQDMLRITKEWREYSESTNRAMSHVSKKEVRDMLKAYQR